MNKTPTINLLSLKNLIAILILVTLLSACGQPIITTPDPTSTLSVEPTATLDQVLPTPTPTAIPEPSPEPSPEPTPTPKPVLFQGTETLSVDNAAQLSLLVTIGEGTVQDLTWLSEGKTLAVCSSQGLDIFSQEPFEKTHRLFENTACKAVAGSPDGKSLAVALPEGKIQILDATSWQETTALQANLANLFDMAWSPDGTKIVVGGTDGNALLYTAPFDSSSAKSFAPHTQGIVLLAWSADSKHIAAGNYDGRLTLWNASNLSFAGLLHGHKAAIDSIAWSHTGNQLASSSEDGSLLLWDVESLTISQSLSGSGPIAWSMDDLSLVYNHENILSEQKLTAENEAKSLGKTPAKSLMFAISPDNKHLATINSEGGLLILDTQNGETLQSYTPYGLANTALATSPDGKTYANLHSDGSFELWNASDGKRLVHVKGSAVFANQIAWSPDGDLLAVFGEFNTVRIFDLKTEEFVKDLSLPVSSMPTSLTWSPDGKAIAVGMTNGDITIWNRDGWFKREPLETHSDVISALSWSPDGQYLAIGSELGVWRYWDIAKNQSLRRVEGHASIILDLAFSPKESLLATASTDGSILLWDTQSYTIHQRLESSGCQVNRVLWSPDATLLASVDSCGKLNIWNPKEGSLLIQLSEVNLPYYGLAWSYDGKTLITSGLNGTLQVWGLP